MFLMYLLEQREALSGAICRAKAGLDLPAGLDGEVGLNAKRQEVAAVFRRMAGLRASEELIPNGGIGYRFNNEGNQVAYRCDVKRRKQPPDPRNVEVDDSVIYLPCYLVMFLKPEELPRELIYQVDLSGL